MKAINALLVRAAVTLALLLAAGPAHAAGGCPLCKQNAAALGEEGQRALNVGILMLMCAVAAILACLALAGWRRVKLDMARQAGS